MELLARTCKMETMNAQRVFARIFVVFGGLFWVAMIWGAAWVYRGAPFAEAATGAAIYAAAIAVLFVIGMFYENLAALLLVVGAAAIVVYGFIGGWETGVWTTVFFFFILPMLIAAVLYYLAARMQRICDLAE